MCDQMDAAAGGEDSDEFFEINRHFHDCWCGPRATEAGGGARAAGGADGAADEAVGAAAWRPRAVRGRAPGDPRGDRRGRRGCGREPARGAHRGAPARAPLARGASLAFERRSYPQPERSGLLIDDRRPLEFGVNLNNREPLIAPDYDLKALLDLSEPVEELGFDSVWVGDSLFSKPRYEPMSLLSAISQRTQKVRLGTACLVTSTRNPLYLALEWATLDQISGGRTILGPCMGNPEEGVRREFEALGLPFADRATVFEEGLEVLGELCTNRSDQLQGHVLRLRRRRLPLGHRDGAAAAAAVRRRRSGSSRTRGSSATSRPRRCGRRWSAPATASSGSATAG